jgi:CRISPR-associated protein Csy1
MIGYGGTKPQNISVLNSTYGGKAYLLPSIPPLLTKQKQRLPKYNFFTNCLWPKNFEVNFIKFHKLLTANHNNKDIRDGLTRRIQSVIDEVIEQMWAVRLQTEGWSAENNYDRLLGYQKIWLDESRKEDRQIDDEWLNEVIAECARWIISAYKKVLGNQAILLADAELAYIKSIIESNKEDLR